MSREQKERELNKVLRRAALRRVTSLLTDSEGEPDGSGMWLDEAAKWATIAEALRPDLPEVPLPVIWGPEPEPLDP